MNKLIKIGDRVEIRNYGSKYHGQKGYVTAIEKSKISPAYDTVLIEMDDFDFNLRTTINKIEKIKNEKPKTQKSIRDGIR